MSESYRDKKDAGRGEESSLPCRHTGDSEHRTAGCSDEEPGHEERLRARKKALSLLTDMDRTERMLTEKLEKAGFSPAVVEDAVEYVRGYGYIDDRKYAAHYIEVMRGKRSLLRIRDDLRRKGIQKEILDEAMERSADWDERPLIRSYILKKAKKLDLSDPRSRQKVIASAARQGFRISDILHVMDVLEEND